MQLGRIGRSSRDSVDCLGNGFYEVLWKYKYETGTKPHTFKYVVGVVMLLMSRECSMRCCLEGTFVNVASFISAS